MRLTLSFALILCGTAAAQTTPDNAASDSLRQRMLSMNLLNPPKRIILAPSPSAAAPKVCAIPLVNARRVLTNDKMHIFKPNVPAASLRAEIVQVPAPACGEPAAR
jgi:hypothetical protein